MQPARGGTPKSVPWCSHSWQCEQPGGPGLHSQGPTHCPTHWCKQKKGDCSTSCLMRALPGLSSSHVASKSPRFLCIASLIVYTAFSAFTAPYNTKSVVYFLSSGRFGLWLDADLYHGRSNSCSTFNNDILTKKEDFIVQDVEVWTFE